jgi:hypothetical protein
MVVVGVPWQPNCKQTKTAEVMIVFDNFVFFHLRQIKLLAVTGDAVSQLFNLHLVICRFTITDFCPLLFHKKINFQLHSGPRSPFTHIISSFSVQSALHYDELKPPTIPPSMTVLTRSSQKLVFSQTSQKAVFTRTIFSFSVQAGFHHDHRSTKHQLPLWLQSKVGVNSHHFLLFGLSWCSPIWTSVHYCSNKHQLSTNIYSHHFRFRGLIRTSPLWTLSITVPTEIKYLSWSSQKSVLTHIISSFTVWSGVRLPIRYLTSQTSAPTDPPNINFMSQSGQKWCSLTSFPVSAS